MLPQRDLPVVRAARPGLGACARVVRGLASLALGGALVVGLGACGDSDGASASNTDGGSNSGTESESDSNSNSNSASDSESASISGSGSDSNSNASNHDISGSQSDSNSGGSGGGNQTTDDTTGDSGGTEFSGGSSATETTMASTDGTSGDPTTGPLPVECGEIDNEADCIAEPECEPAKAERYNLNPFGVCKQNGVLFMACVHSDACIQPSEDFYCYGNETKPWFDFLDSCVPPNYANCNIPQQDNYPICM